ncbi:MAG TPA: 2-oxoglutarate dehydrogenase E1 component [Terriglobia bacterium]|nr:2-oxoglutarate dehydrogenase E1 component [Terriglobia bacterium]
MSGWRDFEGANAGYVAELYERFRQAPASVDAATRAFFERAGAPPEAAAEPQPAQPTGATVVAATGLPVEKIVGAINLAESIRKFGHLDARLDPLGSEPPGDPSLRAEFHGVTEDDLRRLPASLIVGPIAQGRSNAWEVIQELRRIYSSATGYDYGHLRDPEERAWLVTAAESGLFRAPADPIDAVGLLERLTQVEVFERFLQRTFPGKTRFSIEGLDMLVPVLDEVIGEAAEAEIPNILIGMAHRGRLNVLAHVLKEPYQKILAQLKDALGGRHFREYLGWTGDVKYHLGARRAIRGGEAVDVVVSMPPNPSHLEAIDPIVEGMARAAGTRVDRPGPPRFDSARTLPILIHGDAAFSGQGVVAETLNLYRLPGYRTGGTIHIIADNQLGYTTDPVDLQSAPYASDLARGFRIPIVHVNADNPEACIEAARLALAYRLRFEKDFVIDLVGYRRYGHNEGDEPSFTQPVMYRQIAVHPTVRELWGRELVERGLVPADEPEKLVQQRMAALQQQLESLVPEKSVVEVRPTPPPPGAARHATTAVPAERLRELNQGLLQLPAGFNLNKKLERARERRRHALDDVAGETRTIDWAMAEDLALASILADGVAIRFTGEDVERGTFSQRHAVLYDAKTGRKFVPLQALPQAKAAFEVHNSPLTEGATIGFEYGYNVQEPGRMVMWEAQYGDFINGAQTMIDEFVVSARAKWGLAPSLVLLLPHGYEGAGPDHSSGRPERFLQLAAEINMRVANCTTAAQYFHLLRLHATLLKTDPLPLVVLTPKSLLRHPLTTSSLGDLAEGGWQRVIDDAEATQRGDEVRRLILCSGKVYVDLASSPRRAERRDVAICRVEQLYPFPADDLAPALGGYPNLEEVVWVQEEPENMGPWEFARPLLEDVIQDRCPLRWVTRPRNASPAEGSLAWHVLNQQTLIEQAYGGPFGGREKEKAAVLVNSEL